MPLDDTLLPLKRLWHWERERANVVHFSQPVASHKRLAFVAVVREPWAVDNDLVTSLLKVKRASIEHRYGPRFKSWANENTKVVST